MHFLFTQQLEQRLKLCIDSQPSNAPKLAEHIQVDELGIENNHTIHSPGLTSLHFLCAYSGLKSMFTCECLRCFYKILLDFYYTILYQYCKAQNVSKHCASEMAIAFLIPQCLLNKKFNSNKNLFCITAS